MKKFITLLVFAMITNFAIFANSLKVNNQFKDQIYITIVDNNGMKHALISGNSAKFIDFQGGIESIIINFQQPKIAPLTIKKEQIPALLRLLTIYASCKIAMA